MTEELMLTIIDEANLCLSGDTVRRIAERTGRSKSSVHVDLTKRLEYVDDELFDMVKAQLTFNAADAHLRGGTATKRKHSKEVFKLPLKFEGGDWNEY